jgi:hypothetical protein
VDDHSTHRHSRSQHDGDERPEDAGAQRAPEDASLGCGTSPRHPFGFADEPCDDWEPDQQDEASESEAGSPPAERADEGVPDGRMHDGADARAGEDDGKREAASIVEPGRDDSRVDDRRIPRHGKTDHQKHRVKVPEIRREQGE